MVLSKRVSMWSVEEVLEWVQDQHPNHMGALHKAIIKHAISGRALLRLKDHHLEQLGVEAEEQQQEIWQDLLLLRVQEEINELDDICSEENPNKSIVTTSAKLALSSWQQVSHLMASNMSDPLPSHHSRVVIGDLLSSGSSQYLVESVLGQGTFGTVAKCRRIADKKTVAIKMMRNQGSLVMQAREEVAALLKLQLLDSDKCNLVRWYQVFSCEKYIFLVFEHLDKSLHDFMEDRSFQPLHLKEIRPIVKQLANALAHLKAAGIIHADLKLENIMLVNHAREPYRVKVIDFGLAHEVSAATQGSCLQTRPYRSPEIILALPYTEAIDMWSLGCVTALLYLGFFLYPGTSGYDMMRYIVETQGQPPDTLLTLGYHTGCFFQRDDNSPTSFWKLKTPEQFYRETGIQSMKTRGKKFSSLYDILHIQVIRSKTTADKVSESNDRLLFGDILRGMLALDAAKRLTPRQVLQHQFTSMQHMVSRYHLSSYVRSCYETMDLCQNLTTDSGKAVGGSLQPSSSSCFSPPRVKRNMSDGDDSDNYQLSNHKYKSVGENSAAPSSSSSSSCFSPRVKRNMADGDDSDNHQLYNHKRKRVSAASPTDSSRDSPHTRRVRPDQSSVPYEHHHPAHTSNRTHTESRSRSHSGLRSAV